MITSYATGARVALASASTATAASYAAGFKTAPPTDAIEMGGNPRGERYGGIIVGFFTSNEATSTVGARVWIFRPDYAASAPGSPVGYRAHCIAAVTGTSSAGATLVANSAHPLYSTTPIALDELAVTVTTAVTTPKGPGGILNTAKGAAAAQVFTPNDDATPALLVIPYCGHASHVYIEMWDSAGSSSTNAMVERFF